MAAAACFIYWQGQAAVRCCTTLASINLSAGEVRMLNEILSLAYMTANMLLTTVTMYNTYREACKLLIYSSVMYSRHLTNIIKPLHDQPAGQLYAVAT